MKTQLDAELEATEKALADTESDALLDQQEALHDRLNEVEQKLAAFVGFDTDQKKLAGCYVSISQDGTPFLDKGLVKPEHRRQLAKLLGTDNGQPNRAKPKNPLSETLCRNLAAIRLQAAQVEIAKHPAIALDLLAFRVAGLILDRQLATDGPAISFKRPTAKANEQSASAKASEALAAIEKSLPAGWRKPKSEAARFAAFRELPQPARLKWLAYSVAMMLQPKLAPASLDEATAYDAALDLTGGNMAGYWRPGKDTYLGRVSRDQLLALARDTLGETWAGSRTGDKKASLVEQIDRAFADPAKYGRTPEQVEKLKSWLPAGMALSFHLAAKPAKGKKAKQAA